MNIFSTLLLAGSAAAAFPTATVAEPQLIGQIGLNFRPAFIRLYDDTIYISTFFNELLTARNDASYRGKIDSAAFPGSFSRNMEKMHNSWWPNEISEAPEGMFSEKTIIIPGGFITYRGEVVVVFPDSEKQSFQLSPDKNEWFYHRVLYKDMNGDGKLDIVTSRSRFCAPIPLKGCSKEKMDNASSQLLWWENNGKDGEGGEPWVEHIMDDGSDGGAADVHLHFEEIDGQEVIVATHFFINKKDGVEGVPPSLNIYSLKDSESNWETANVQDGSLIRTRFGEDITTPFDFQYLDLNNDGKKEFLVSNHEPGNEDGNMGFAETAAVAVYEVPENFLTGEFKRTDLTTGFVNRAPNPLSPGAAQEYYPTKQHKLDGKKPWIVVAGDGDGRAWILKPKSEEQDNWEYDRILLHETEDYGGVCTVGAIAIQEDFGENECSLIYVPAYENNDVFVYADSSCGLAVTDPPTITLPPSISSASTAVNTIMATATALLSFVM